MGLFDKKKKKVEVKEPGEKDPEPASEAPKKRDTYTLFIKNNRTGETEVEHKTVLAIVGTILNAGCDEKGCVVEGEGDNHPHALIWSIALDDVKDMCAFNALTIHDMLKKYEMRKMLAVLSGDKILSELLGPKRNNR